MSQTPPSPDHNGSARLWVDGGARGNPGPAGAGAVLERPGEPPLGQGRFLGEATNNVAEYRDLLLGLRLAGGMGVRDLTVFSDSELMVRQLNGTYRVRDQGLKEYYREVKQLLASAPFHCEVKHIPRSSNKDADRLANVGIDAGKPGRV